MVGAGMRGAALVALAAVSASCREPAGPEPVFENHRTVYAVLEVASADVAVLAELLNEFGSFEPLRGAQATVSGGFGSLVLAEASTTPPMCFVLEGPGPYVEEEGCYTGLLPQPAAPTETLGLDLRLPDGDVIEGSLVMPGLPVASIPAEWASFDVSYRVSPDFYPIATIPVVLASAPGARRVDVVAHVVQIYDAAGLPVDMTGVRCTVDAATTPFKAPRLAGTHDMQLHGIVCARGDDNVGWTSLDVGIHVIAMEQNYAGYMNQMLGSSAIDLGRAGFGLQGAVGVFGAVATTVVPFTVTFVPG